MAEFSFNSVTMLKIFLPDQILFRHKGAVAVPFQHTPVLVEAVFSFLVLLRRHNQCFIAQKVAPRFLMLTTAHLRLMLQQWLLVIGHARVLLRLVGSGAFFSETANITQGALKSIFMCAGTSHVFFLDFPVALINVSVAGRKKKILVLMSYNLPLLQRVAFQICKLRKPDPYKGKGLRLAGEIVRRKQGKTGKK